MRRFRKFSVVVIVIVVFGVSAVSGWLTISPPDLLLVATGYAANMVCSNVFIAKRDADAVIATDVEFALSHTVKRMRIKVDTSKQRVEVAYLGLFARRYAQYEEGRGCALDSMEEVHSRAAATSLPPKTSDALWPAGDRVQLSDDKRLRAVLNDPAFQGPGMRAIVVVRDGHIVGEAYGEGFGPSTPLLGWSMTKTVNAALVGLVIKDGKLSLDQKNLFPQWADDARKDISVANLMSMTSGLKWSEEGNFPDTYILEDLAKDAAAFARDRPLVAPPGTKFNYSGGSSVLLARLWQNAVGADAQAFPQERLFKRLGMTSAVLEADPSGTFLGEAYLFANARDWARFGEFLRLNGEWNGKQLLPSGFVDYMRSPVPASDEGHGPAYGRGQLWLGPGQGFTLPVDTFMMQGHLRQVIAIIPSLKLVALRMGLTREDIGYSNAKLLYAIVTALKKS
ncbi:serine hydrolase [Rhizobium sp. CNPSo 4039]|uniref:serine hydrolase domain-containing protein n=1 Tax=Rhizobium sp. CNPSo 4039 TaxID=3021409 RepID=UPI00254EBBDA|nr:serine hydrolase [Rhizobium sp. CNPSo 4039]MDK4711186.1 serine hydrolase [Rhizobium sp. CNPSo 4039]